MDGEEQKEEKRSPLTSRGLTVTRSVARKREE
jgi:hypothetical protein